VARLGEVDRQGRLAGGDDVAAAELVAARALDADVVVDLGGIVEIDRRLPGLRG
jgi:hypothetical protein